MVNHHCTKVVLVVVTGSSSKLSLKLELFFKVFFLSWDKRRRRGRKETKETRFLTSVLSYRASLHPLFTYFFSFSSHFPQVRETAWHHFFRGKKTLKTWSDGSSCYSYHYLSEQSQYKKIWLCGNGLGWNQIGPSSSPLKEKIVSLQIATSFSTLNSYWYFAQTSVSPMSSSTIWSLKCLSIK